LRTRSKTPEAMAVAPSSEPKTGAIARVPAPAESSLVRRALVVDEPKEEAAGSSSTKWIMLLALVIAAVAVAVFVLSGGPSKPADEARAPQPAQVAATPEPAAAEPKMEGAGAAVAPEVVPGGGAEPSAVPAPQQAEAALPAPPRPAPAARASTETKSSSAHSESRAQSSSKDAKASKSKSASSTAPKTETSAAPAAKAEPPAPPAQPKLTEPKPSEPKPSAAAPDAPQAEPSTSAQLRQALQCMSRGDNECVIRALEGKATTSYEIALLVATYRSVGEMAKAKREMKHYLERFPSGPRAAEYDRFLERQSAAPATPADAIPAAP